MHEVDPSGVGSCFKEEAEVIQTAASSVFSFELAGASACAAGDFAKLASVSPPKVDLCDFGTGETARCWSSRCRLAVCGTAGGGETSVVASMLSTANYRRRHPEPKALL